MVSNGCRRIRGALSSICASKLADTGAELKLRAYLLNNFRLCDDIHRHTNIRIIQMELDKKQLNSGIIQAI